jgi:cleavage and polyadenylation specificity factor subunit 1
VHIYELIRDSGVQPCVYLKISSPSFLGIKLKLKLTQMIWIKPVPGIIIYLVQSDIFIDPNFDRDLPYSPSFVLAYNEIDEHIRNVVDVVFLPGFNTPTIAILFQPEQTWTGCVNIVVVTDLLNDIYSRLKETKDNTCLFVVSLDIVTKSYQVIMAVERLPYDSLYLVPCPHYVGGVIIVSANAFIHVDHASKTVVLPVSGWAHKVTDIPLGSTDPHEDIQLEGSRAVFIGDITLFVVLATGTAYIVRIQHEGRLVRSLVLQRPIGILPPPSEVISLQNMVFVASSSAQSVLLQVKLPAHQDSSNNNLEDEQSSGMGTYIFPVRRLFRK